MTATSALLLQVDRAFRTLQVRSPAPPTRFYLNLTQTCQLRCAHCITGAPEKTADGTAQNMTVAVLDALRPHLAHALYVGLTHAGEPMLAPLFVPALQAVKDARAGQPTVVHLLTNGLAMTVERLVEVAALGVNSLSISMDGMSAGSHDLLRVGSRIQQLLPRVEALAQARREHGLALRMGLACTLHRNNVTELDALLEFAARAGLDWVKLEEMYPINPVAKAAMVDAAVMGSAVTSAVARGAALGVRVLDHTQDHQVWKCRVQEDVVMAAFSAGDDFINRMDINPCRLPWELCCVEPNGDLKPMGFNHAPAGNILERPLLETWNGPAFAAARIQSVTARLCVGHIAGCPTDGGPEVW